MIRAEVAAELARIIAGSGVTGACEVFETFPGDKYKAREMVFGDRTTGVISFPFGMAPPRIQQDDFTVLFVVRITGGEELAEARARCQELANLIAGILADSDLKGFTVNGERVTDTNTDQGVQVETREGVDPPTGVPVAIAEITVPIQTRTEG